MDVDRWGRDAERSRVDARQDRPGAVDPEGPDRSSALPRAVPEADVFALRAVQRGGVGRQLPWGSGELSLVFDATGIQISGDREGEHSFIPWTTVSRVSRGATRAAAGGGSETMIGIESPGRIMRFAVHSDRRDPVELSALSDRVGRWSALARPTMPGPGGPVPVLAPVDVPAASSLEAGPPAPLPVAAPSTGWPPPPPLPPPPGASRSPGLTGFPGPGAPGPGTAPPPRRRRRLVMLVVAVVFLASGAGLAVALATSGSSPHAVVSPTSSPSPDQVMADRLMLTQSDLPDGWSVSSSHDNGAAPSPRVRNGEARITRSFARCMGITESQAAVTLGGSATDQTAQSSSPVFVGPPVPAQPGFTLELQTAADIVHSHADELSDFGVLSAARFPQCAGAAVASETQLGANSASGGTDQPGAPSVSVVDPPVPAGVQVVGVLVSFTVSDGSSSVPVEVETVSFGHDRVEANLQALAIGGSIPAGALSSPVSVFADRVAGEGQSTEA